MDSEVQAPRSLTPQRLADAGDELGAGLAAALAMLGGVSVWLIAATGVPAAVPIQYRAVAWLIPFMAAPAALCAAWSALALWRAARRTPAALAFLASGAFVLLGSLAAVAHEARLAVLLSIIVPLVIAYIADVALLRWAARLAPRSWAPLLGAGLLPLVMGLLGWPGPLWSIATLIPAVLVTPAIAAAYLTGAPAHGRPRGAPVPALAFFVLPVALFAGTALAAGAGAMSTFVATLLLPFLFWPGSLAVMVLGFVVLVLLALRGPEPVHAAPGRPAVPAMPTIQPEPIAGPAPTSAPDTATAAGRGYAQASTASVRPDSAGDRRSRVLALFTDHFLAGDLSEWEYERQIGRVLGPRAGREVPAARQRPEQAQGKETLA